MRWRCTRKDTHNKRHFIVLKVLFFFQIRCVRKKRQYNCYSIQRYESIWWPCHLGLDILIIVQISIYKKTRFPLSQNWNFDNLKLVLQEFLIYFFLVIKKSAGVLVIHVWINYVGISWLCNLNKQIVWESSRKNVCISDINKRL